MDDLKKVLPQVGFDYSTGDGGNYQDNCPRCRRRLVTFAQSATSWRFRLMAHPPVTEEELIDRYGPHLNRTPKGGWDAGLEIDRQVKTHCCFCGQQCGIILKVKDDEVVGFEPWYEFPFNEGKLCPKGVKRYLQNAHPDRLLEPARAGPGDAAAGSGRPPGTPRSIGSPARSAGSRPSYGPDSFAVLSGVSLTNEKSLPDGQVRPPRHRHGEPRLQRPALHGVGRQGEHEGARDRSGVQPVERHPAGRRRVPRRDEHRRVLADHHQLHLAGTRPRRQADRRRSASDADRPDRATSSSGCGRAPTRR